MLNIIEQFKLYKQHKHLLKQAKDLFPTTQIYNNFKDQADKALREGDLSQAQFALETFSLMQQGQTSPLYRDSLNQKLLDPMFSQFSDFVVNISPKYEDVQFTTTPEMTKQLIEDTQGEDTIVTSTPITTSSTPFKASNKKVLNIVNGIIQNSEVMYTADGIVTNTNTYTTNKIEELREVAHEQAVKEMSGATSSVLNSYQADQIAEFDKFGQDQSTSPDGTTTVSETALEIANAILDLKQKIDPKFSELNSTTSELLDYSE
ncbi:MAG: hypothetical protein IJD48_00235 [Clostridia bacterium]|nr:hypothetical protein [Clostridia bacterium]